MASPNVLKLTFLPWTAEDGFNRTEKQAQSSRRHQHTALVYHRRKRLQRGPEDKACYNGRDGDSSNAPSLSTASDTSEPESPARTTTTSAYSNMELMHSRKLSSLASVSLLASRGGNRFGPFNVFPDQDLSEAALKTLDHALMNQWPAFALSTKAGAVARIRKTGMTSAMSSPCTLHAIIYASEGHRFFFSTDLKTKESELLRLYSKSEALKQLHGEIQRFDGVVSDEILLAITLLAIHGTFPSRKLKSSTSIYRDVEFSRDVEFYHNTDIEPTHVYALYTLVERRGGLQSITLHGLADMIAVLDIYYSHINLVKPVFPPLRSKNDLMESFRAQWDDIARQRNEAQKEGFTFLTTIPGGPQLLEVIRDIRTLHETYNFFLRDPRNSPNLMHLVFGHRAIEHSALSLEPSSDCLFEVTRLTVLIYILESLQPLPRLTLFHTKVTHLLKRALLECDTHSYWQIYPDFLLWATLLGGLAARQGPLYRWYIGQIRNAPVDAEKGAWAYMKSLSSSFLILESALAQWCHQFWDDACDILSSKTNASTWAFAGEDQ